MLNKNSLLAALLLAGTSAFSQTQTLEGFTSISSNGINPIINNNEVKGYSLFYKGDKADRKNSNYGLKIYDENLKMVKEINLVKPKDDYVLVNNVFNDNALGFLFYNFKEKTFEIETYGSDLTKLGSQVITDVSKRDNTTMRESLKFVQDGAGGYSTSINIMAIPGKGFVKNGANGMAKGWQLEMFDNKAQTKWKIESGDSKDYESIIPMEASSKYMLVSLFKRSGAFSTKYESYLMLIDNENGKKLFEIPVESEGSEVLSITGMSIDEQNNEIVTVGDYYAKGGRAGAGKSLGFYTKRFGLDGKEKAKKFYSWDTDIRKAAGSTVIDGSFNNYTHKIARMDNGKTYILVEQFKRNVSAAGVASMAAAIALGGSSSSSLTKGVVGNMLLFVVNPDLSLHEVLQFNKNKSNVALPSGAELYGTGVVGRFLKMYGDFDYQFFSSSANKKTFNAVYVNYDKDKGEKAKNVVGNIILTDKQMVTIDELNIPFKDSPFLYPAKPGYIMMVDYLKKQKQLGMKLVKMNQ